jgi:hypothetical protein
MRISMPSFGYTTVGVTQAETQIWNYITGSIFTCPQDGDANSITAHIWITDDPMFVKCAIYRASDLSLIATTEEKTIPRTPDGGAWNTFNFLGTPPALVAGVQYLLVVWAGRTPGGVGTAYVENDPVATYLTVRQSLIYGASFPSVLVPTYDNSHPDYPTGHYLRVCSIYCTYTAVAPPPTGTLTVHAKTT